LGVTAKDLTQLLRERFDTIGIEAGRATLGAAANYAYHSDFITFLTRNGSRIAAIVSSGIALDELCRTGAPHSAYEDRVAARIASWIADLGQRGYADLTETELSALNAYIQALHAVTLDDEFLSVTLGSNDPLVELRRKVERMSDDWSAWVAQSCTAFRELGIGQD